MKINKIRHSYDLYCLDIWLINFNILRNTIIVHNGDKTLFDHLFKHRGLKDIRLSNYKFRNGIDDISKYKDESFNKINNKSIHRISFYF